MSPSSGPRVTEVPLTSTGSPQIAEWKYSSASASERLTQPWVTFELPCAPALAGLAWMNSPLLLIRTAQRSGWLEYPYRGLLISLVSKNSLTTWIPDRVIRLGSP